MNQTHKRNIALMLLYLRSILNTEKAGYYNHDNWATCTFGFAIDSGIFPQMGREIDKSGSDWKVSEPAGHAAGEDYEDTTVRVFGAEYKQEIALYASAENVNNFDPGRDQLHYMIGCIEKFCKKFDITTTGVRLPKPPKPKPKPDLELRIQARIDALRACEARMSELDPCREFFKLDKGALDRKIANLQDALNS
jgi:hypothetical protein